MASPVTTPVTFTEVSYSLIYRGHVSPNGGWDLDGVKLPLDMIRHVQVPEGAMHIGESEIFFCPDTKILDEVYLIAGVLYIVLGHGSGTKECRSHMLYYLPLNRIVSIRKSIIETRRYPSPASPSA
jgi:hypothetical protein